MDPSTPTPDSVFCMRCGPGTALHADEPAHALRCPRCAARRRLPGRPLFVVTGASGTGKSTIVEGLRRRLPDCGLKTGAGASVVTAGHAFVQNLRRGHYELAVDEPVQLRVAAAFADLAPAI